MSTLAEAIASSLAPGIALNGAIFFNTSLQNRFIYITGRMRECNREARSLRGDPDPRARERVASLRTQVDLLTRRTRIIRRSILMLYGAILGLILTILQLLLLVALHAPYVEGSALVTFAIALVGMAVTTWQSWTESYLSQRTILEDIRTSYDAPGAEDAVASEAGP
jgi:hypothetical protein